MRPKLKDASGKDIELGLDARIDTGRWLTLRGTVQQGRGLLVARRRGRQPRVRASRRPRRTTEEEPIRVPAGPPPEVIFSAPTEDETDVLHDDDRADPVLAGPRSGDAEGTHQAALSRVAERRTRRAGDADRRLHVPVRAAPTACSR